MVRARGGVFMVFLPAQFGRNFGGVDVLSERRFLTQMNADKSAINADVGALN